MKFYYIIVFRDFPKEYSHMYITLYEMHIGKWILWLIWVVNQLSAKCGSLNMEFGPF